jgi:hypothetical protein
MRLDNVDDDNYEDDSVDNNIKWQIATPSLSPSLL